MGERDARRVFEEVEAHMTRFDFDAARTSLSLLATTADASA